METLPNSPAYYCEFEALLYLWPAPVALTRATGETLVVLQKHDKVIEATWKGHISADDVVTAAKLFAKLLQQTPCPALLNDKSGVTGDWADANDWLEFEWLPQVLKAGLRCMAHVYSSNMFSRLSAHDLYQRITPALQMQNFDNRLRAELWLAQCQCRTF